ncbi:hypothetical protein HXX76_004862 [Chlamydomonas incerta]|uniref:Uncharacterized protein n=1 Tax=Chlamydomonas incerta TaxID=51695 RepID=A0A835T686_CHLIN|nr:hypothetical protein HXX76_004862 [Chlamydomonas incerta]|eukprot:KAG2439508.1 hypothetical protein HXX76_004862 [Chlamydomonas incerta]
MFAPAQAPESGAVTEAHSWLAQLSGSLLGVCYLLGAMWGISCGLFSVGWELLRLLTARTRTAPSSLVAQEQQQQQQPSTQASEPQTAAAKPPTTPTPVEKAPAPAAASPPAAQPTIALAEPPAGPVAEVGSVAGASAAADPDTKAAQAAEAGREWLARHGQQQQQHAALGAALKALAEGLVAPGPGGASAAYADSGLLGLKPRCAGPEDGEQSEGGGSSAATTASFFTATSADPMSRRSESPVTPVAGAGRGVVVGSGDCEPGSGGCAGSMGEQVAASARVAVAEMGGGDEGQAAAARPAHKRSHHGHRRGGAKGAAR